jgi:hypothetical protein
MGLEHLYDFRIFRPMFPEEVEPVFQSGELFGDADIQD